MKSSVQHIQSKSRKTTALLKHAELRRYVPATKRFNKRSLRTMLRRYRMVYVKPDKGRFGNGVMRVEESAHAGKSNYRYQLGVKVQKLASYNQLYRSISKHTARQKYITQQGIHLLQYRTRCFDIRVMVQLSPRGKWETTGIIARVAAKGRVVTNYHNHGLPLPVEPLLVPYMNIINRKAYTSRLKQLGLSIAKHLQHHFPNIKEIGVDIGIDRHDLQPWILEVNTRPDPFIFKRLKNKRIFKKIMRYAKAYGKYKSS